MSRTKDLIVEKIETLTALEQEKVLDFVENLRQQVSKKPSKRSLMGRLAYLGIDISKEEIDQARRESWNNFPREIN